VRAVALSCVDAIVAGDLNKARTLAASNGLEFNLSAGFIKAFADFKTDAAQKFADAAQTLPAPLPDPRDVIRTGQVTINGDTAQILSPLSSNPIYVVRVAGAWKTSFLPPDQGAAGKIIQSLNSILPIYGRVQRDLDNGKFKTIEELKQALDKEFAGSKIAIPSTPATAPAQ
jgi:hypothetical protein